jgi:hypothetical protein
MPKFLIEVEHKANQSACEQARQVFLNKGIHFLTNADWGCLDGVHKAWFFMDTDSKDQALEIIPSALRQKAKIITLSKFSFDEMDRIYSYHG